MEKQIQEIYNNYLTRAKEVYGELPKHCYETKIVIGSNPDDHHASGASCIENKIYLNPESTNVEWVIFHEMEHIRLARNIGKDHTTGFYDLYEYKTDDGIKHGNGEAINEALTDISVEYLLGKEDTSLVAYYETIQLVKQLFALLGVNKEDIIKYCQPSGKDKFIADLKELTGYDLFISIDIQLSNVHDLHILDLDKEYNEFGAIKCKPLGLYCSNETLEARLKFQRLLETIISFMVKKLSISRQEITNRLKKMNELSPYKNGELEMIIENLSV